jgi:tRNA pseudouridine55 synthase
MTAGADPFGILLVDKPVGPTSHDVVHQIRRSAGVGKVGHTGTLDPMASGLLVLCLGSATRLSEYLTHKDKRYLADIRFGIETDSHDAAGQVVQETGLSPDQTELTVALDHFKGTFDQTPPSFSAIRVRGKRAYQMARTGRKLDLKSRQVTIYEIKVIGYRPPSLKLAIHCSAGTYIRSLARDLGRRLESGAHLSGLRRTAVGSFEIERAHTLETLARAIEDQSWLSLVIPAAQALPDMPEVRLGEGQLEDIRHGRPVQRKVAEGGLARGISPEGDLVAILESASEPAAWHPRKVFIT